MKMLKNTVSFPLKATSFIMATKVFMKILLTGYIINRLMRLSQVGIGTWRSKFWVFFEFCSINL